jgi:hypothetical protein
LANFNLHLAEGPSADWASTAKGGANKAGHDLADQFLGPVALIDNSASSAVPSSFFQIAQKQTVGLKQQGTATLRGKNRESGFFFIFFQV